MLRHHAHPAEHCSGWHASDTYCAATTKHMCYAEKCSHIPCCTQPGERGPRPVTHNAHPLQTALQWPPPVFQEMACADTSQINYSSASRCKTHARHACLMRTSVPWNNVYAKACSDQSYEEIIGPGLWNVHCCTLETCWVHTPR